jgi:carbonic anhydrase
LRVLGGAALIGTFGAGAAAARAAAPAPSQPSADVAWRRLSVGNARYAAGKGINCGDNFDRRLETASAQQPFAIVLACADSRVAPELVFDQRIGDLFTIRVAGNIADEATLGSIEYAVDHFGSPLLVVMGHERCGAVEAALAVVQGKAHLIGHVAGLVAAIEPAVRSVLGKPGDTVDNAVRANIRRVVAQLREAAPVIAPAVSAGKLRIVGVRYGFDDGIAAALNA